MAWRLHFPKKFLKIFQKALDKGHSICYNINVRTRYLTNK
nr:MAG TPA: hypothetical protein [Caudoviricetes sp.]